MYSANLNDATLHFRINSKNGNTVVQALQTLVKVSAGLLSVTVAAGKPLSRVVNAIVLTVLQHGSLPPLILLQGFSQDSSRQCVLK